jgi:uroporphyrin-III C-methyltransferase
MNARNFLHDHAENKLDQLDRFDRPIARGGRERQAPTRAQNQDERSQRRGHVSLVGAGPGDPDLLTLKAFRLLTNARIVAHDELIGPEILALIPKDAERIAVGRRKGTHPDAPSIDPRVLERALAGHDVVRLKGGDPFIFGRGGEEAAELAALHIPFEVVPGISAALGAAASTGIPLTHRDAAASSVTFATAHLKLGDESAIGDASRRIPLEGTVVLYMGLATLADTARQLIDAGRSPKTPAAVISRATLPDERVVIADLATIAKVAANANLKAPALVIIGEVVAKRVVPALARPNDLVDHRQSRRRSG